LESRRDLVRESGPAAAVQRHAACRAGHFCFAHDGNLIVVADGDTHVRGYDRKGKLLYTAEAGLLEPCDLSLSADGKTFAVAGAVGAIALHDSATGRDGISHSPKEFTAWVDVGNGAEVLYRTVVELDGDANNANKKDRWSGYKPCCHGKRKGS